MVAEERTDSSMPTAEVVEKDRNSSGGKRRRRAGRRAPVAGGWARGVGAPLCSDDLDVGVIGEGRRVEGTGIVGGDGLDERYITMNKCK